MGSPSTGERDAARRHLDDHLASAKKSWNDLPELLKAAESEVAAEAERKRQRQAGADDPDGPAAPNAGDDVGGEVDESTPNAGNPFDLTCSLLQDYIYFKEPHELIAVALWTMHSFVFDRFRHTPKRTL